MSQHPLHHNLDDVLADFIGSVSEFRGESTPGYWSAVNAIQKLSVRLRTLRQKPCVVDDQDIVYGCHSSKSLLRQRQLAGDDCFPSSSVSSTGDCFRYDKSRSEYPSSLSSATSLGWSADGHAHKTWSPMVLDFGPGRWKSHDNEHFFTSHTSAAHPLSIETVTADRTIDPRNLSLETWDGGCRMESPPQYDLVQPSTGSALLTDAEKTTDSAGGAGIESQLGELQNRPEGDATGHEADDLLELLLTQEALGSPIEVPAEHENDPLGETDTAVHADHGYLAEVLAEVQPITDASMMLTIRNVTTPADHPQNEEQHAEDSSDQTTRKPLRKGRKKKASRARGEKSIGDEIVQMSVNQDCLIEPETVYRLIESNCKNTSPSKANLRSLTRFFYGLASPLALREFREVCQSARADLRFLARDLGLPETLQILKQAEELACEASNARRMSLARIRYVHQIKVKEIKRETGLDKDRTVSRPAYERMIAEELPSLAKGEPEYVGMFDHLKSKSSQGRHWIELGEKLCRGLSLLVLVPHSGPHAVHDSDIERVSDDEFDAFLKALVKLRGTFLEEVAAKTDQILEAMQRNTPRQLANRQLADPTALSHELRELFGYLEPEMTLP